MYIYISLFSMWFSRPYTVLYFVKLRNVNFECTTYFTTYYTLYIVSGCMQYIYIYIIVFHVVFPPVYGIIFRKITQRKF